MIVIDYQKINFTVLIKLKEHIMIFPNIINYHIVISGALNAMIMVMV